MDLSILPTDIVSIVCEFAYHVPLSVVKLSLKRILEIKRMKLPRWMLQQVLFSYHYNTALPSPLRCFEPMMVFGDYNRLFNTSSIMNLLYMLDFRRKTVSTLGSRQMWMKRMGRMAQYNYRYIQVFALFFRYLFRLPTKVMKPGTSPDDVARYITQQSVGLG